MSLISREELLKNSRAIYNKFSGIADLWVVDSDIIRSAPEIDAESIVHRGWTLLRYTGNMAYYARCACGYQYCCGNARAMNLEEKVHYTNYCPNCGARMDLTEENQEPILIDYYEEYK
jgi:peptide subunit release factor 1 (eRF1)